MQHLDYIWMNVQITQKFDITADKSNLSFADTEKNKARLRNVMYLEIKQAYILLNR